MMTRCPVCAYDMDKLQGDVTFTVAPEGTVYEGIGRGMLNIEFLPVFADEIGPFGSLTSDSARTFIEGKTKDLLFNIVSFHAHGEMETWLGEAERLLKAYAGAEKVEKRIWQGGWIMIP
jgi:DNA/RNA-binding domain of Phe-tRNA-synthetase-like protein